MYEILDIDKRSKHIKDFTLINEWENLTALSNRRLRKKNLCMPFGWGGSIDRITMVGKGKKFTWIRENLEPIE